VAIVGICWVQFLDVNDKVFNVSILFQYYRPFTLGLCKEDMLKHKFVQGLKKLLILQNGG
jgi:hypothetical protein